MTTLTQTLLTAIQSYCQATGMTERAFGIAVANNHKLVSRLRAECGVTSQTHDRIIRYIDTHPPSVGAESKLVEDAA